MGSKESRLEPKTYGLTSKRKNQRNSLRWKTVFSFVQKLKCSRRRLNFQKKVEQYFSLTFCVSSLIFLFQKFVNGTKFADSREFFSESFFSQSFLRDCPEGRLNRKKFTETYQKLYPSGKADEFCRFVQFNRVLFSSVNPLFEWVRQPSAVLKWQWHHLSNQFRQNES